MKEVFDREHMKKRHGEFVDEINHFMQGYRVLCVSALNDSERMWARYAQDHQGIVLRILPNVQKDSKYQLFRPVAAAKPKRLRFGEAGSALTHPTLALRRHALYRASTSLMQAKTWMAGSSPAMTWRGRSASFRPSEASAGIHNPCRGYSGNTGVMDSGFAPSARPGMTPCRLPTAIRPRDFRSRDSARRSSIPTRSSRP
jgi:hypothetical protein